MSPREYLPEVCGGLIWLPAKLGKGVVTFLRATLGFEQDIMHEGEQVYSIILSKGANMSLYSF
jgi:hypothetical protein